MHVSKLIDARQSFTKLIKENLYGEGQKTEGRAALFARRGIDNFIFDMKESDIAEGKLSDLAPLRSGIIFGTYTELLDILSDYSKRFGIKQGMQAILADPDVRGRFDEERQDKMRAIASSFSFLAKRRFDQLDHSIRAEIAPFYHSKDESTLKGAKLWSKERTSAAQRNFRVAFDLHEQPNDQFKVTWDVSTMPGRHDR